MKKAEIQNLVKELSAYDSNYDNYIMTKQDISILADELLAKINNTRCSTQLKLVYTNDFCRWLESGFTYYDKTSDFLCKKGYRYSFRELVNKYEQEQNKKALIV